MGARRGPAIICAGATRKVLYPADGDQLHIHAIAPHPPTCPLLQLKSDGHHHIHPGTPTRMRVISPRWLTPSVEHLQHTGRSSSEIYLTRHRHPRNLERGSWPRSWPSGPPALMQARCAPSSRLANPTAPAGILRARRAHATRQNPPRSQRVGTALGFSYKECISPHAEPRPFCSVSRNTSPGTRGAASRLSLLPWRNLAARQRLSARYNRDATYAHFILLYRADILSLALLP